MLLSEIIIEKIRLNGPISFCEFMEMALYYPGLGYYTSAEDKIGTDGDYYTSPYLTNIFGEMIGKQLEEMWSVLDRKPFTILEYGAGPGTLCLDILNYLKNNPALYDDLQYCIVEKSPVMVEMEKKILHEKVRWLNSLNDISPITGCILANEVVDNFSVHQVIMKDELMEVFVDHNNGFAEVLKPASEALKDYLDRLGVVLPNDFRTEINLEAIIWIKESASALKQGFALTIDYGYPSAELYDEQRRSGTLVCYKDHIVNSNFYAEIGNQDITAHVNFTALKRWGMQYGLEWTGYTDQAYFLRSLGLVNHLRKIEDKLKGDPAAARRTLVQLNKLLLDMGKKFKVLIQHKGIQKPMLSGLQFSQPLN